MLLTNAVKTIHCLILCPPTDICCLLLNVPVSIMTWPSEKGPASTTAVLLQLLAPPASGVVGDPWSQQPLCKLQSPPLTLLPVANRAGSISGNSALLFTALQDKSVHKYQLNMPTLTTSSKAKVLLASDHSLQSSTPLDRVYLSFAVTCL